jgi:hypothetical protein
VTAAELIAKLSALPPDTIVAIKDPITGLLHHVSTWPIKADQWGVAVIGLNLRVVTEEDVS